MKVKIYSKENCDYCVKAKMLLKSKGINYEEYSVYIKSTEDIERVKKELKIDDFKTVPQISIDGKYIGGYDELRKYFNKI